MFNKYIQKQGKLITSILICMALALPIVTTIDVYADFFYGPNVINLYIEGEKMELPEGGVLAVPPYDSYDLYHYYVPVSIFSKYYGYGINKSDDEWE